MAPLWKRIGKLLLRTLSLVCLDSKPDNTGTSFYLATRIVTSLRPLRVTARRAAFATLPVCRGSWPCLLFQCIAVNVMDFPTVFRRMCRKWSSSIRRHESHPTNTLLNTCLLN